MKRYIAAAIGLSVLVSTVMAAENLVLKDHKEKVSYSIGVSIGHNLKRQEVDVDTDILLRGIRDALSDAQTALTEEQMRETLSELSSELSAKRSERMKQLGEVNKKQGEAFLEANKKKEGVETLPSGLQYKVVKEGNGPSPKAEDTVKVNYRGTLIDGTEFDSSYKHGQPATVPIKNVIKGWQEALPKMKVGSTWQLFIPSDLAYGERGSAPNIGPDTTLLFEVELVEIKE